MQEQTMPLSCHRKTEEFKELLKKITELILVFPIVRCPACNHCTVTSGTWAGVANTGGPFPQQRHMLGLPVLGRSLQCTTYGLACKIWHFSRVHKDLMVANLFQFLKAFGQLSSLRHAHQSIDIAPDSMCGRAAVCDSSTG